MHVRVEVDTRPGATAAGGRVIRFMSGAKIAINFPDQRRKKSKGGEHDNMPTWHILGGNAVAEDKYEKGDATDRKRKEGDVFTAVHEMAHESESVP